MPRDACKEGAPEWAIASAGVAAMKVLIFSTFIFKKNYQLGWKPDAADKAELAQRWG